ncbi:MAG: hypothetical protein V4586_02360 [Pseudomonadota bacterium]
MPLRDAVRRSGESFLDAMPMASLPGPAAELAEAVLREVGEIAEGVDEVASGLARFALGASSTLPGSLHSLTAKQGAEDAFAKGVYAALRFVLTHLNVPGLYQRNCCAGGLCQLGARTTDEFCGQHRGGAVSGFGGC